jgi:hypothetical protein
MPRRRHILRSTENEDPKGVAISRNLSPLDIVLFDRLDCLPIGGLSRISCDILDSEANRYSS